VGEVVGFQSVQHRSQGALPAGAGRRHPERAVDEYFPALAIVLKNHHSTCPIESLAGFLQQETLNLRLGQPLGVEHRRRRRPRSPFGLLPGGLQGQVEHVKLPGTLAKRQAAVGGLQEKTEDNQLV